jgi:hypothetical protein
MGTTPWQGVRRDRRSAQKLAAERAARRRGRLRLLGGAVAVALVLAVGLIALNRPGGGPELPAIAAVASPYPDLPAEGRVLGDPAAPVTVVEWGDYQ